MGVTKKETDILNKAYAHFKTQEDTVQEHTAIIHNIQDILAIEDLAALHYELKQIENQAKELLNREKL